jgi:hypothetical protein
MRYVLTDINRATAILSDPEEAVAEFTSGVFTYVGGAGQTVTFAPEGGADELRIDIDTEADRAAVIWLPDGSYGVELPPNKPITVYWYIDAVPVDVPAEYARVSTATATNVVRQYVATGERPTCVTWTLDAGPYPLIRR